METTQNVDIQLVAFSQFSMSTLFRSHCSKFGQSGVPTRGLSSRQISRVIQLMDSDRVIRPRVECGVECGVEYRGEYIEHESSNLDYFFIGSYTNNSRSGEFLTNSEARSSYSPKFAL